MRNKVCLSKCFISSFNVSVWAKESSIILYEFSVCLIDYIITFSQECVVECEEHLSTGSSWSLCKRFMQNADNTPEGNRASTETELLDSQQHPVDKKYGGFMKRYGGFMKRYGGFMKKTAELYGLWPKDVDYGRAILTIMMLKCWPIKLSLMARGRRRL